LSLLSWPTARLAAVLDPPACAQEYAQAGGDHSLDREEAESNVARAHRSATFYVRGCASFLELSCFAEAKTQYEAAVECRM
jgi:hypothetical protein